MMILAMEGLWPDGSVRISRLPNVAVSGLPGIT
jgi:hypothetical protein